MRLYLDLDGTLLRRHSGARCAAQSLSPADRLEEFLAWATTHFHCLWLTSRDRDGGSDGIRAALRQALGPGEDFDRIAALAERVASTTWRHAKAEGIDFDHDFLWLDDAPDEDSLDMLAARGLAANWIAVAVDQRPDDLARAMGVIGRRAGLAVPA